MRSRLLLLLVLVGLVTAGHAYAQTWANPLALFYNSSHAYAGDTCQDSNTIHAFDGFDSPGPDVVYRLNNRRPVGAPVYGDSILTLYPAYWPQMLDFEVWVCADDYGYYAWNCAIEADNISSYNQQPISLYMPAAYKTYHIVVTSGNGGYGSYSCGPYTLYVQRLVQ